MTTTVLVTGATGTIGSALVPELVRRGATVRTMSRREHELSGTQNAVADLRDPASLERAVAGTDTVFLNSPSEPDAAMLQCRFADIAAAAGVRQLVLLSQYAATADSPVRYLRWHAQVEQHVRALDVAVTVLRPNLYMQGLLPFAANAARTGVLAAPIENAKVSAIDTRDIAEVAAAVLTESGHAGATYTLTGPRAVTHTEIAAAFSAVSGRDIEFTSVTPEQFAAALEGLMTPWRLEGLLEDYAHYDRGEAAEVYSTVSDLLGRPARSIEQFAHDHATAISAAG